MIEQGGELGLTPPQVLDLTVRELHAFVRGRQARDEETRRLMLWTAWHVANWQRAKRIPAWRSVLRKIGRQAPVKRTTRQLLKMAEHLNALFGGRDLRGNKDKT